MKSTEIITSSKQLIGQGDIEQAIENLVAFLENTKANITTRNFPDTVENIRKKWKIYDGGNTYVFFTTNLNNTKIVLVCSKI